MIETCPPAGLNGKLAAGVEHAVAADLQGVDRRVESRAHG